MCRRWVDEHSGERPDLPSSFEKGARILRKSINHPSCETCKYWDLRYAKEPLGICQRNAPRVQCEAGDADCIGVWPETDSGERCGEYAFARGQEAALEAANIPDLIGDWVGDHPVLSFGAMILLLLALFGAMTYESSEHRELIYNAWLKGHPASELTLSEWQALRTANLLPGQTIDENGSLATGLAVGLASK